MPSMQLFSGRYFNLVKPDAKVITIYDIAHSLSNICRFGGHSRQFYSVAQHSILVSHAVRNFIPCDRNTEIYGLLHDAAEAFIGDIPSPLKQLLPDLREIESRVERALFESFNMPLTKPAAVRVADSVLLATERRDLMPDTGDEWEILDGVEPLSTTILPMTSKEAMHAFLTRYEELGGAI